MPQYIHSSGICQLCHWAYPLDGYELEGKLFYCEDCAVQALKYYLLRRKLDEK